VRDVAAKLQNLSDCEAAGDIRGCVSGPWANWCPVHGWAHAGLLRTRVKRTGAVDRPAHDLSQTLFKTLEVTEKQVRAGSTFSLAPSARRSLGPMWQPADMRGRDQNTVEYGNYALWLHTQSATLANCKVRPGRCRLLAGSAHRGSSPRCLNARCLLAAAQLALANRIAASEKYDAACKNTRKKREAADKAKADKAAKAQAELAEAEKTEADLKDAFFHISDSLKAEFARVEADRTADARAAITHVTNAQVKLATDIGTILEAHGKA